MRPFPSAAAIVWCLLVFCQASHAAPVVDIDAKECQAQLEALLRPDIDCTIEVRPGKDELKGDLQALQPLLSGMSCRVPLKFKKAQVYGEWVGEKQAKTPDLPVTCTLTGSSSDQFSGSLRIECTRPEGGWSCGPVLHNVKGLGILRRQLEQYVNNDSYIRTTLTKYLTSMNR